MRPWRVIAVGKESNWDIQHQETEKARETTVGRHLELSISGLRKSSVGSRMI